MPIDNSNLFGKLSLEYRTEDAIFMDATDISLFLFCFYIPWAVESSVCLNIAEQWADST